MKNKINLLIYPIIFFLCLFMNRHTAIAYADTEAAHMMDKFEYEYEGQIMEYEIHQLPNDTTQGIVALIGPKDKTNLTGEVHIPTTVTYLGAAYSVTRIEQNAFNNCINITGVDIPEGITYLGWRAFYHCISLTNVTFSESKNSIGDSAFAFCTSLKSIKLPTEAKTVWYNVFFGCTALENVVIPDGLTAIYPGAFENCVNLQNLPLPESVTSLTTEAFKGTNIVFEVTKASYAANFCKDYRLPCIYTTTSTEADIPLDDIFIKQREMKLYTGKEGTLNLLFYPLNTTEDRAVIWSSSDQSVATVDANGVVIAVKPGRTKITAVLGTLSAECTVIVNPYSPKSVKAESTGLTSIKISWNPVKNVGGYGIYRATSETGVYSKVKDISYACYKDATYYEDTNLNHNITYYYKVRSYDYGTSAFSKVVSAKPKIAVPQVSASSFKNNKIKIHWKWVTGSKGYQIYRSASKNGAYKLYKTVPDSYYVDNDVTKGKTYYYYVKAYYNEKNNNIYSDNSKTVSAVAKTPPTPKLITLGTSLGNVYKILGRTTQKVYCEGYLELLYKKDKIYGTGLETAHIYLQKVDNEYVVIGWYNIQHGYLSKFSDGNEQNTGTFTLGSSLTEVNKVMGTPDCYELDFAGAIYYPGDLTIIKKTYIKYSDGSVVSFNSDRRVVGWENKGCLKLKYQTIKPSDASITRGTSLTDVIKALGNPDKITENGWGYPKYVYYGNTILTFDNNQLLIAWEHKGDMKITIGEKESGASKVQVGSSLEDVIKALGTPDSYSADGIDSDYLSGMAYGKYNIKFDSKQMVSSISKTEGYLTTNVDSVDMNP